MLEHRIAKSRFFAALFLKMDIICIFDAIGIVRECSYTQMVRQHNYLIRILYLTVLAFVIIVAPSIRKCMIGNPKIHMTGVCR